MIIRIIDKNRNMRVRDKCLPGLAKMASPLKVDLTKKTGLGPRTDENLKQHFPQGNDKFIEDMEDPKQREKLYNITEKERK